MSAGNQVRRFVLAAIRAYQRYLSPFKGYACAYRVHTGHASCSTLGFRAVRKHGVRRGLAILRERTYRCGVVHRRYMSNPRRRFGNLRSASQRGECDPGCDLPCDPGCDLPSGGTLARALDCLSDCGCGSCDWPKKPQGRDKKPEQHVYIPPKRRDRTQPR